MADIARLHAAVTVEDAVAVVYRHSGHDGAMVRHINEWWTECWSRLPNGTEYIKRYGHLFVALPNGRGGFDAVVVYPAYNARQRLIVPSGSLTIVRSLLFDIAEDIRAALRCSDPKASGDSLREIFNGIPKRLD